MISSTYENKKLVIGILTSSFVENKSVNYIVKQDNKRISRIQELMDYSFEVCYHFGKVYLSDDRKACALVLFPEQKKTTFKSIWLDIKLIIKSVGIFSIDKALHRESKIKEVQDKGLMYYLWFIGVDPSSQGKGSGTKLMNELIVESESMNRPICLETSTLKNLPWYKKFSFEVYQELDLSYKLFFLKRPLRGE